jgi:hypothetical protein
MTLLARSSTTTTATRRRRCRDTSTRRLSVLQRQSTLLGHLIHRQPQSTSPLPWPCALAAAAMFDVIWTDPNRELVGEHRAKKDRNREKQTPRDKDKDKDRGDRSSLSTRSSLSSADSPFSFLRSKGLRQARAIKGTNSTESVVADDATSRSDKSSLPLAQVFDSRKNHRRSGVSTVASRPSQEQSIGGGTPSGDMSPSLTCYDSIFSRSPESDTRTSNSVHERASEELSKHSSLPRAANMQVDAFTIRTRDSDVESSQGVALQHQPLTPPQTPLKGYAAAAALPAKAQLTFAGLPWRLGLSTPPMALSLRQRIRSAAHPSGIQCCSSPTV